MRFKEPLFKRLSVLSSSFLGVHSVYLFMSGCLWFYYVLLFMVALYGVVLFLAVMGSV